MANIDMRTDAQPQLVSAAGQPISTKRYSQDMILVGLIALDAIAIVACGLIVDSFVVHRELQWGDFASSAVIASIFYAFVFNSLGSYRSLGDINIPTRCGRAALAWIAAMLVLVAAAFMLKVGDHYSRIGASVFAAVGLIAIVIENAVVARLIKTRLKRGEITFARLQTIRLVAETDQKDMHWTPPAGFHRVRDYRLETFCESFQHQCRELRDALQQDIVTGQCDQIVIAADWTNRDHIETLLRHLGPLPAPILLLADSSLTQLYQQRRVSFGSHVGFELQSAPLGRVDRALKRAMDIIVAVIALVVLSPILMVAAIAVWFEMGFPILFRQDRRGYGGVPFQILKFRSMTVAENGSEIKQAERGDRRVTNVGRLLRRTSIDELPQLFNVLKGDMSIVGPRPHAKAHDDHYDQIIERYAFRHHVKPGITGWAQVHGARGATETPGAMQKRVEYDLWYINHWSLWLDVRIILRTAFKILADDNAY